MRTGIPLKHDQKLQLSLKRPQLLTVVQLFIWLPTISMRELAHFQTVKKRKKNLGDLCLLSLAWFRSFNAFGGSEGLLVSMSCPYCTRGAEKQNGHLKNPGTQLIVECPESRTWFLFEVCIKMFSKDLIASKPLLKALTGDTQGGRRPSKSCSPKWSFFLHGHTMTWKN